MSKITNILWSLDKFLANLSIVLCSYTIAAFPLVALILTFVCLFYGNTVGALGFIIASMFAHSFNSLVSVVAKQQKQIDKLRK